ncbi:Imm53 family immunity protein [Streptomyces hazeniae]|uniref:Imm53 family immunity protein n=1 Tax=Streptomyces hazeniae TaxID=3075538 RepID=UPI00374E0CA5
MRMARRWKHLTSTLPMGVMPVHPKIGKSHLDARKDEFGMRFMQSWYASNCDGEWEHEFGLKIATTDNPGWHIKIDVCETSLEGILVERERCEFPDGEWMIAWSDGTVFQAACSPLSLCRVDAFFERLSKESSRQRGDRC